MSSTEPKFLRNIIGEYMVELGDKSAEVVMVNADLMGTCRNSTFFQKYPQRTFNVGIAEQNLVSFAAGLAHEGFIAYAFSMAPFISMRACEQCRTDVAYGNLNVRLLATYAGCSGGISGATHWSIEDCAIMNSMPNMTIMEPCDAVQEKKMMEATLTHKGPIYLRSSVEPVRRALYDEAYEFKIGKASVLKDGVDGAFICSGVVVQYAFEAAIRIQEDTGKKIRVVDMHTIKPLDRDAVISAAETGNLVVAQDHNIVGGLGYCVAEVLAEEGIAVKYINAGIKDEFAAMAHAPFLYHRYGIDTEGLEKRMLSLING